MLKEAVITIVVATACLLINLVTHLGPATDTALVYPAAVQWSVCDLAGWKGGARPVN